MAVREYTKEEGGGQRWILYTWTGLLNGDSGRPVLAPEWSDRAVQFDGTTGVGLTILLEGSNDDVSYFGLKDPADNAISLSAAGLRQVLENPKYIRPRVSAGDGATNMNCRLMIKQAKPS